MRLSRPGLQSATYSVYCRCTDFLTCMAPSTAILVVDAIIAKKHCLNVRHCCAGIPNSGKSSLINALRHAAKLGQHNSSGGKAATGATPGLTRHIAGFQVLTTNCSCFVVNCGVSAEVAATQAVGHSCNASGLQRSKMLCPSSCCWSWLCLRTYQHDLFGLWRCKPRLRSRTSIACMQSTSAARNVQ